MDKLLKTEKETIKAGAEFAERLKPGDIVLLHGELGSGKTTFVKGIAQGLGIKKTITSPTFSLMNIYKLPPPSRGGGQGEGDYSKPLSPTLSPKGRGGLKLCHIDTYRLKNADELRAIGAQDYIGDPETITVIEWPEKIEEILPPTKTKSVHFEHVANGRKIWFS
jgi:tRNA threonylcarbamoyladenosine biosynthesis protein TsaE